MSEYEEGRKYGGRGGLIETKGDFEEINEYLGNTLVSGFDHVRGLCQTPPHDHQLPVCVRALPPNFYGIRAKNIIIKKTRKNNLGI